MFIKLQGSSQAGIKETSRIVKDIVEKHGGTGYELAKSPEDAADLWADRKNAHFSTIALLPGCQSWPTDVWCA
jgi:D-lactate dehydrogenase (cytochrome)